jgi:hypothetical protein
MRTCATRAPQPQETLANAGNLHPIHVRARFSTLRNRRNRLEVASASNWSPRGRVSRTTPSERCRPAPRSLEESVSRRRQVLPQRGHGAGAQPPRASWPAARGPSSSSWPPLRHPQKPRFAGEMVYGPGVFGGRHRREWLFSQQEQVLPQRGHGFARLTASVAGALNTPRTAHSNSGRRARKAHIRLEGLTGRRASRG